MAEEAEGRPRFRIRGETRLKNARLIEAREEVRMSCKEFAEHVGIDYGTYNAYENMRKYPRPNHAQILAAYCNCKIEELFPLELKKYAEGEEPRKLLQMAEIEPSRLLGAVRREALLAPAPTPEDEIEPALTSEAIQEALSKLKPIRRRVLELRFGMNGDEPMTLDEIATLLKSEGESVTTRERVRQIQLRALTDLKQGDVGRLLSQINGNLDDRVSEQLAEPDWTSKDGITHVGGRRAYREYQRLRRSR